MENKNVGSDREKMIEDILSMVDGGSKQDTGVSRAERAAASSANRAASERKESTSYQRTPHSSNSAKRSASKSAYNRTTSTRRNTSAGRTGAVNRSGMRDSRTAGVSRSSMNEDKTVSVSRNSMLTGSMSRSAVLDSTAAQREAYDANSRTGSVAADYADDIMERMSAARSAKGQTHDPLRNSRSAPRRRKRSRFSGRLPMVLIITTIIFTVAISLSILIISVARDMLAIGKSDDIKIITIPEGVTTEQVAQILCDEGIIKMPKAFEFVSKLGNSDTKYIAGDHELSPSNAYETIINELTTDKSLEKETVDITFVEGCDIISAAKQLEEANVCEAERFIYYFNAGDYGYEFENHLPASTASKFNRMEGYLFPDTYTFYVETDPEVVCQKIYKNFDEKFKLEYYTKMKQMNMTLDEVITLASIVQAESPDVATMKKVASVFENRLASPEEFPQLQSDPTTYYVEEVIKPNIKISSEAIFEAYDTYQCIGLPPGAIGNPGIDAIEAVLYPEDTNYYFFYANVETMETFFAVTDEEHEANKEMVSDQQSDDDDDDGEE